MEGHGDALNAPEEVPIWEANPAASSVNPAGKAKVCQLRYPAAAGFRLAAVRVCAACRLAQQNVLCLEVQVSNAMGMSMRQACGNPMHETEVLQVGLRGPSPRPKSIGEGWLLAALHHTKLTISLTMAWNACRMA